MMKNLKYYLNLPYKIEIVPIPAKEGGGYVASLPEIGRFAVSGDGETRAEAVEDLEKAMIERFSYYIKKGIKIPEPEIESDDYTKEMRTIFQSHKPAVEKLPRTKGTLKIPLVQ